MTAPRRKPEHRVRLRIPFFFEFEGEGFIAVLGGILILLAIAIYTIALN